MKNDNGNFHSDRNLIHAEREWIRQMFAGTVHNIGNVITVAKLAVSELKESNQEKRELVDVILNEMLPTLKEHSQNGTIHQFLTEDDVGTQFLESLEALLNHKVHILDDQHETISSLDNKFDHVAEIINLQQRLIRGTGHREEVRCKDLIEDAIKMMGDSASRHHVEVCFDDTYDAIIDVDPSMVTQVFINLIKNGIEALDRVMEHPRAIRISINQRPEDGMIVIAFADNGPGISAEHLERIFDFGFSTKSPGDYNRGVGLNYCRGTVEKFKGTIAATSRPNQGTTFTVCLPEYVDDDE